MTNIHSLLKRLLEAHDQNQEETLTADEVRFARWYLNEHQAEIHFWVNDSGNKGEDGTAIMEQHYFARGEPVDIFSMLTEAAMANEGVLSLINAAYGFFRTHVPECPDCKQAHTGTCQPTPGWNFKPAEVRLLPLSGIQQLALISFLDLSIPAMAAAERPMETDILKHLGDIKEKLAKIVLRLEPTPEKSKAPQDQELKFRVYHQFTLYLQRMRLQRSQMIPVQLTETERAFFGGWGQLLILLKENVSKESEEKQFSILGSMIEEVGEFWDKQKKA